MNKDNFAPQPGTFIVLEGADGSGKATQFKLLTERLKAVGYDVAVFDFPRYDQPSSHFVRAYLNGEYGPAETVSPYTASLFYALDRFEAAPQIRQAIKEGKVVLCNRYVGSNMAHQGSKLGDAVNQRGFFVWEDSLEYQLLGSRRVFLIG
jgi:dTMP kinase